MDTCSRLEEPGGIGWKHVNAGRLQTTTSDKRLIWSVRADAQSDRWPRNLACDSVLRRWVEQRGDFDGDPRRDLGQRLDHCHSFSCPVVHFRHLTSFRPALGSDVVAKEEPLCRTYATSVLLWSSRCCSR